MEKIKMKTPLVEMGGDEMAAILWGMVKEELLEPFVELDTRYYDLGLPNRERTADQVTMDSALATRELGVAVKCATITPNIDRVQEYGLSKMWKSPNATIRAALDGTVFRAPILAAGIGPYIRSWKRPITLARHAYGDLYRGVEIRVPGPGKCELVYTNEETGEEIRELVHQFKGPGIAQGVHNLDKSILSFARCCLNYALSVKQDLLFSAKDTISKVYDRAFRDLFQQVYEEEFAQRFAEAGITYQYCLIDDAVSRAVRDEGGYVWACQNYDGDVMSDMVASAYGSAAMMTSVLMSPDGCFEYEAAHGTVRRHYYRFRKGEPAVANPIAIICAWAGALEKRGELDGQGELVSFARTLRDSALLTIEDGVMTPDLAKITIHPSPKCATSLEYIRAVRGRMAGLH